MGLSLADVPQQHECKDEEEDEEVRTEEPPCLHSRPHHEESENPLAEEDGYINSVESNHSEEHCGADRGKSPYDSIS